MFNVFQYAIIIAAVVSIGVTALLGFICLPVLRRLHFGQTINEVGPTWHKGKQGTPTMGGIIFIVGSFVGLVASYLVLSSKITTIQSGEFTSLAIGMLATFAFGLVGFLDDYLKVRRTKNLGLCAWQKLVLQFAIAAGFIFALAYGGNLVTTITLPVVGALNMGIFFYPFAIVFIVGMVNAVNLTDGIDGLASSVTVWVMCGYIVLMVLFDKYDLALWATSIAGGCIGFLFWNFYPAKMFMGDTGSLYLGGVVAVMAFCMGRAELAILLGFVYLFEAFSVILQVSYFKITKGKRIFKMSPIHHHFEMIGWSEPMIVGTFSFVALACAILAIIYGYITK